MIYILEIYTGNCLFQKIVYYGDLTLISEAAARGQVQRKEKEEKRKVLDAIYLIHYISSCPGCCTYSVAHSADLKTYYARTMKLYLINSIYSLLYHIQLL